MAQFGFLSSFDGGVQQYSGYMMPIFNSGESSNMSPANYWPGVVDADPKIKALEGNDQISAVIGKLKFSKYTSLELKKRMLLHFVTKIPAWCCQC